MSVGRQGCSNNGNVSVRTIKIFIGLFLGYGYYNTMRGTFSQQLRSIASELQIPLSRIGLPASMFSAAYGVGKFLTSIVSDYVPCAECHALGLLLCGINIAALGLCTSLTSLSWLWCLQGFVQACGWPFLARIVVTELPSGHRAKFWGVLSMAGSLGAMLSPYGMVFARQWGMSWQRAFFFRRGQLDSCILDCGLVALWQRIFATTARRKETHFQDRVEVRVLLRFIHFNSLQPSSACPNGVQFPELWCFKVCQRMGRHLPAVYAHSGYRHTSSYPALLGRSWRVLQCPCIRICVHSIGWSHCLDMPFVRHSSICWLWCSSNMRLPRHAC